jgi:hypothetical protein
MEIPNRPTFNKQISRNALEGTPSSSSSKRTRFKATISIVSLFFPGNFCILFFYVDLFENHFYHNFDHNIPLKTVP